TTRIRKYMATHNRADANVRPIRHSQLITPPRQINSPHPATGYDRYRPAGSLGRWPRNIWRRTIIQCCRPIQMIVPTNGKSDPKMRSVLPLGGKSVPNWLYTIRTPTCMIRYDIHRLNATLLW